VRDNGSEICAGNEALDFGNDLEDVLNAESPIIRWHRSLLAGCALSTSQPQNHRSQFPGVWVWLSFDEAAENPMARIPEHEIVRHFVDSNSPGVISPQLKKSINALTSIPMSI
jgi:hypothetical protein